MWVAIGVAAAAGLLLALIQQAVANGLSVPSAFGPARVGDLVQFRFGRVAVTRLALLAVAAALAGGLFAGGPRVAASWAWRLAGAAVGLGLLQTLGAVGHSTTAGFVGMSARLVHVASVSVWLGGLFLLVTAVAPRRGTLPLGDLLPRFSTMAGAAVVTLASSGLAMAIDLVGPPANLVTSPYGRTLALKSALVAGVLVVASRSRALVHERLLPAPAGGRGRTGDMATATRTPVTTWIAVEVVAMVAVVGISALLTAQPPPP